MHSYSNAYIKRPGLACLRTGDPVLLLRNPNNLGGIFGKICVLFVLLGEIPVLMRCLPLLSHPRLARHHELALRVARLVQWRIYPRRHLTSTCVDGDVA